MGIDKCPQVKAKLVLFDEFNYTPVLVHFIDKAIESDDLHVEESGRICENEGASSAFPLVRQGTQVFCSNFK